MEITECKTKLIKWEEYSITDGGNADIENKSIYNSFSDSRVDI